MSNAALNWAFAAPIKKSCDKLLLVCLANYANDDGICWPSQAKLVDDTSLDRKTVIGGIRRLLEGGWITDTGQKRGATGHVIIYRLSLEKREAKTFVRDADLDDNGPVFPGNGPVFPGNGPKNTIPYFPDNGPVFPIERSHISHQTVPYLGHGTIIEPPIEPPLEPSVRRTLVSSDLFGAPLATTTATKAPTPTVKPQRVKPTDETPEFRAFWEAYPRKRDGAGSAVAAWHRAMDKASAETVMAGLARFPFSADPQYVPMAATWLNQQRWRTEADTAPRTVAQPMDRRMQAAAIILGRPEARGSPPQSPPEAFIDIPHGDWNEH